METIVANISGKPWRAKRDGREWLVAPVSMIVPGVLNGSSGPLHYLPEDIRASVSAWNGMPLTLRHPSVDGKPVSAKTEGVLDSQGIGKVLNSTWDDKLKAEAWFDVELLRKMDPALLSDVENGKAVEVSTGLGADTEQKTVDVDGSSITITVAKNLKPDHLAVLPDATGACSVSDGCGISVNQNSQKKESEMTPEEKKVKVDFIIANCAYCDEDDRETITNKTDEKIIAQVEALESESKQEAIHNAATKDIDVGGDKWVWNADKKEWTPVKKKEEEKKVEKSVLTNEQEETLAWAHNEQHKQRQKAVDVIVANKDNKLTPEQLKEMSLDVLRNVADSFAQPEERVIDYSGAAGGPVENTTPKEESFASWGDEIENAAIEDRKED